MRCCVYVGYTSKSPEERLQDHLNPPPRYKRTVVTECGGMIRPDLGRGLVFRTQQEAEDAEASLAAYLQDRNYTVFGAPRPR